MPRRRRCFSADVFAIPLTMLDTLFAIDYFDIADFQRYAAVYVSPTILRYVPPCFRLLPPRHAFARCFLPSYAAAYDAACHATLYLPCLSMSPFTIAALAATPFLLFFFELPRYAEHHYFFVFAARPSCCPQFDAAASSRRRLLMRHALRRFFICFMPLRVAAPIRRPVVSLRDRCAIAVAATGCMLLSLPAPDT